MNFFAFALGVLSLVGVFFRPLTSDEQQQVRTRGQVLATMNMKCIRCGRPGLDIGFVRPPICTLCANRMF